MKKKPLKILLIVIAVITVIGIIGMIRGGWIPITQVERVTFSGATSCELPSHEPVELSSGEIATLLLHYNFGLYAGPVNAESCDSDLSFTVYLKDGSKISAREANAPRFQVYPSHGESYWIRSAGLAIYAKKLVEKYDLPTP